MAMRRLRREQGKHVSATHTFAKRHVIIAPRPPSASKFRTTGVNTPPRPSLHHDERAQDGEHDQHYDSEVLVVAVEAGLVERGVPDAAGAQAERATEGTIGREDF